MKYLTNLFSSFVYSNLFIAGCALLMLHQTDMLFNRAGTSRTLAGFVFFSTICSYSFHWYLTDHQVAASPRINWLKKYKFIHVILFIAGFAGSVYYFLYLLPYWPWLIGAAAGTFLYSAPKIPHSWFRQLRKVALGKTIFLAFVWMYVTTVLPIIVSQQQWNGAMTLFVVYRFFQVYAICILFDYRDREDDRAAGIRSLVTFMTEKNITRLFICSLLAASAAAAGMLYYDFPALVVVILFVPCLITAMVYNYARRNFPDLFYYFSLDGLMALSALLMLVACI